jgi:cell division protein FtsW (lipid II flippase)
VNLILQRRLLLLTALFLILYALVLTLSPAVRARSWEVDYRLAHWGGLLLWGVGFIGLDFLSARRLGEHDPYLIPLLALLSGWGLLTIFRLDLTLGWRQSLWLMVGLLASSGVILYPSLLSWLQRYKYVWLTAAIILTALTLILGRNPAGNGPRLWLGCCGVYFQPSEVLKLLFVTYLAAYLSGYVEPFQPLSPLLRPTLLVTAIAVLLLIVQRDSGTASLMLLLYAALLYAATGRKRIVLLSLAGLLLAAAIGYFSVPIVHQRIQVWLFPWEDPSGSAYQIVQSLMAIANGGVFGRGPGLGSPGLVPVAHSDFIFSAIAEETGLLGALALFTLWALLFFRGLIIAFHATTRFHRLLATGISLYLGLQGLVIMGGNLRLFPLTGVTLPLFSYGGSSLLAGMLSITLLLLISHHPDSEPLPISDVRPYSHLGMAFLIFSLLLALSAGWWALVRAEGLLARTDNPRRALTDRLVRRGSLLDRQGRPLNESLPQAGGYQRVYHYPPLSTLLGYTHPVYGQAGLEASLDDWLRGMRGNPALLLWWHRLAYGTPPPGLDVRLSLDLSWQRTVDEELGNFRGAIVLMNPQSGEVLAVASHPWFDPNQLETGWEGWMKSPDAPFLNRALQGRYAPGNLLLPWEEMLLGKSGIYLPSEVEGIQGLLLGHSAEGGALRVTPLEIAPLAATLNNAGVKPPLRLVLAVNTPQQGWVIMPAEGEAQTVLSAAQASTLARNLTSPGQTFWEYLAESHDGEKRLAWYLAGTPPEWSGPPLVLVVLLEDQAGDTARQLGRSILHEWMMGKQGAALTK